MSIRHPSKIRLIGSRFAREIFAALTGDDGRHHIACNHEVIAVPDIRGLLDLPHPIFENRVRWVRKHGAILDHLVAHLVLRQ